MLYCDPTKHKFGTIVDDVPSCLDNTRNETFSITACDNSEFFLRQHGPTAYIPVRRPTEGELSHCPIVNITEESDWDPYKDQGINGINVERNEFLFMVETLNNYLLESHNQKL